MDISGDIINRKAQADNIYLFSNQESRTHENKFVSMYRSIYDDNKQNIEFMIKKQQEQLYAFIRSTDKSFQEDSQRSSQTGSTCPSSNETETPPSTVRNSLRKSMNTKGKENAGICPTPLLVTPLVPSELYYKQFFSSNYIPLKFDEHLYTPAKPFFGLGPLSVSSEYDIDPDELGELLVIDYASYVDHLCRQAMYSQYIYEKGQEYVLISNNIYNWEILTNYYEPLSIDYDWSLRYGSFVAADELDSTMKTHSCFSSSWTGWNTSTPILPASVCAQREFVHF